MIWRAPGAYAADRCNGTRSWTAKIAKIGHRRCSLYACWVYYLTPQFISTAGIRGICESFTGFTPLVAYDDAAIVRD